MLRVTERNFENAFEKGLIRVSGSHRNFEHVLTLGWYTEEEIQLIRMQLGEITRKFHSSTKDRKKTSKLFALTMMLIPVENKKEKR
jgi:hypothetical protein